MVFAAMLNLSLGATPTGRKNMITFNLRFTAGLARLRFAIAADEILSTFGHAETQMLTNEKEQLPPQRLRWICRMLLIGRQ